MLAEGGSDTLRPPESVDGLGWWNCCECRVLGVVAAQMETVKKVEMAAEPSGGIERLRAVALFNRVEKVAVQCGAAQRTVSSGSVTLRCFTDRFDSVRQSDSERSSTRHRARFFVTFVRAEFQDALWFDD